MSAGARPLRFIFVVMALWCGVRVWTIWPQAIADVTERIVFTLPGLIPMLADDAGATELARAEPPPKPIMRAPRKAPAAPAASARRMSDGYMIAHARASTPLLAMLFMSGSAPEPSDAPAMAAAAPTPLALSDIDWQFGPVAGDENGPADAVLTAASIQPGDLAEVGQAMKPVGEVPLRTAGLVPGAEQPGFEARPGWRPTVARDAPSRDQTAIEFADGQ